MNEPPCLRGVKFHRRTTNLNTANPSDQYLERYVTEHSLLELAELQEGGGAAVL